MRSDKYKNNSENRKPKEIKKQRKDFLAEFHNIKEKQKNNPSSAGVNSNTDFGQSDKSKGKMKKKKSGNGNNGKKKKRIWPKVLIVLLILIGVSAAGAYYFLDTQLSKFDYVETDYEEFGIDEGVADKLDGYRNIAILGTDERQGESSETSRTDAIIIATVNEDTGDITLTSVMRDSYLLMDDRYGESFLDKATHAHAFGGPVNTCKMLNQSLDLNISEFIVMDWVSVADTVDALGGITIDVQENELADLNKWGPETASNTGREWTEITSKSHPTKITSVTDSVLPEIRTNMNTSAFTSLIPKLLDFNISKSVGYPFNYWGGIMDDGIWYAVPTTLEENNARLHEEVFGDTDYQMSNKAAEINQKIINETGITEGTDSE